jgi:hypothetical protein
MSITKFWSGYVQRSWLYKGDSLWFIIHVRHFCEMALIIGLNLWLSKTKLETNVGESRGR